MDETIIYIAAFVTLLAVAVAASILAVRRDGRGVGDLIKQLILWVSIAALLPLTSWAGATMLHPRTPYKDLLAQRQRLANEASYDNVRKDPAARKQAQDEQERLRKRLEEEQRQFYGAMFWVAYPTGLAALVAGLFLRPLAVGTGLAFGGLCTLIAGCYSYWNDMGDALRFFSLLIVLAIAVAVGLLKFGKSAPAQPTV